jgi:hypothetical protein
MSDLDQTEASGRFTETVSDNGWPEDPHRIVGKFRREYGFSKDLLAEAFGCTPETVAVWQRRGETGYSRGMVRKYHNRIDEAASIVTTLDQAFTREEIRQTLAYPFPSLNNRSIAESLARDHFWAASEVAEQLVEARPAVQARVQRRGR